MCSSDLAHHFTPPHQPATLHTIPLPPDSCGSAPAAGGTACKQVLEAGLDSPEAVREASQQELQNILQDAGFASYAEKTVGDSFLFKEPREGIG